MTSMARSKRRRQPKIGNKRVFTFTVTANSDFTQAVCILITSFQDNCPEGGLGVLHRAKYYFISCDNISSVAEIYGC